MRTFLDLLQVIVLLWLVVSVQRLNENFVKAAESFWKRAA